jgi:hypothetical protein
VREREREKERKRFGGKRAGRKVFRGPVIFYCGAGEGLSGSEMENAVGRTGYAAQPGMEAHKI